MAFLGKDVAKQSKRSEPNQSTTAYSGESSKTSSDKHGNSSKLKSIFEHSSKKPTKKDNKQRQGDDEDDTPREPLTSKQTSSSLNAKQTKGTKSLYREDPDEDMQDDDQSREAHKSQTSDLPKISKKRREREDDVPPNSPKNAESLAKKRPKTDKSSDVKKLKKVVTNKAKSKKAKKETSKPLKSQPPSKITDTSR